MKSLVVDASTTLCFLLKDEHSAISVRTLALLKNSSEAEVPGHWWLEVANGLLMAERRRRVTASQAAEALYLAQTLPVLVDNPPAESIHQASGFAREHSLTVYDAAYIELALRRGCGLATIDRALARAARATGIELLL